MSRDYQEAFFGSYVNIPVSYLEPEASEQLITRPTPDFPLNYHPEVVQRIIYETHGQPLLIQRICQELVNHLNHELFDLEKQRDARVLPGDLDAVLSDKFVLSETRYFDGIWNDQIRDRPAEKVVMQKLAAGRATTVELSRSTGLHLAEVESALEYLKRREQVEQDAQGQWDLVMPLMRRWLSLRGTSV